MAEQRLYRAIADQLAQLIEDGSFPPGSRLPGERELANRFGVSRVTIREAEIALQAVGRIEIKTGSGVYVCESQSADASVLPDISAFELTEARSLVESEAAALAAKMVTHTTLRELERLISEMETGNAKAAITADRGFHLTIAQASGNGALLYTIKNLLRMREEIANVKARYDSVCEDDPAARISEHKHILTALVARDSNAARAAMREHFMRLISAMLDVTEREALLEVRRHATASRQRYLSAGSQ